MSVSYVIYGIMLLTDSFYCNSIFFTSEDYIFFDMVNKLNCIRHAHGLKKQFFANIKGQKIEKSETFIEFIRNRYA